MRVDLLDYPLPEAAIAQRPTEHRDGARLLVVGERAVSHRRIVDWPSLVPADALVVLNDTRVRRSRLRFEKSTGGKVELLVLDVRPGESGDEIWTALGHSNRPLRIGKQLELGPLRLTLIDRGPAGEFVLSARGHGDSEAFFEQFGLVPLPPYIRRVAGDDDVERYQTVFADQVGSAAAPTAGLHLTPAMLATLRQRGVEVAFTTLHVGAGTFMPVRTDDLDEHPMHAERYTVSQALSEAVARARARGGPVVAVGTTVVRALESAADPGLEGRVQPRSELTRLLIQPGYRFRVVDALLTNFHAPRSTLLALVSAFAGRLRLTGAYAAALNEGYRFLSYGDAMWLSRRLEADLEPGAALETTREGAA
ncbi:MAG TPA: tRNA preQ1(34) S-adenosylmethionine ribosyltransferase-isomerase QueA [Polyangiaceae bacterium]|nr:tRNA preQ1(34) S-adenosylmethionine ribosyltransferase-isomerase QueA [Polyangiaceae bacterium]